ncbi:hypothetical protein B0H16DRAFT_1766878 [Mycena metata]|uniref:NACHT domain-containing protein n=1 Tax=Mycena metata TaxID=1033252 RepID=A0AAD7I607_9AGAR|nr:hypothetical protein B0H16DRAFT_1766878 [Mycena metata]
MTVLRSFGVNLHQKDNSKNFIFRTCHQAILGYLLSTRYCLGYPIQARGVSWCQPLSEMSHHDPATQGRIHNLTTWLTPALTLLGELNDVFELPFIQPIVKTVQALIAGVQDGNKIKQFFRQSEVNRLLKECQAGVDQAIEIFKVQTEFTVLNNVIQVQHEAEAMHRELLELVATLSDGTVSDKSLSVLYKAEDGLHTRIFHGRDPELKDIMSMLSQDAPRIAILGGGGMGKTSLARVALHHKDTCTKFEHRFFVSAEAATTTVELAALIGLHLGLEPGHNLTKPVVQYFAQQSTPCFLVLDNLETPWEPIHSRGGVEDFLSLLTDVTHLALMVLNRPQITMRGSERPGQQIFEEITDDLHVSKEKTQLLAFTENMPLAVNLMAHLVDYEGLANVLARWKIEKTAALSIGDHRTSNLDVSIALSYSSPRITPGARELLTLLSILPDGLSAIRKSFHDLLAMYEKHKDTRLGGILTQITANLANLEEVLHRGLQPGSPDFSETVQCVLSLSSFFRVTRGGVTALLEKIPIHLCDHRMQVLHIIECLKFLRHPDTWQLVNQGISHLQYLHNPMLEAKFYAAAGRTFFGSQPTSQQLEFLEKALKLSQSIGDSIEQCDCLIAMAKLKWRTGDYTAAFNSSRNAQQLVYQTTYLYQVSRAMHQTAVSLTRLGDYVGSLSQLNRARAVLSLCGITSGFVYYEISGSQAEIHLQKSEYTEARSIHAMALQDTLLDPCAEVYGVALLSLSEIDVLMGETKEMVHLTLNRARKIFTDIKNSGATVYCDMISADVDLRKGNKTLARTLFQDCLKSAWAKDAQEVTYCLERLADVSKWPIEFHVEAKWPMVYLCYARMAREKLAFYKALLFIGDLFIDVDQVTAQSLFIVALEGFTFMNVHHSRAQCMLRLGDLAQKKGETTEAVKFWQLARPLFERSSQAQDVTTIDTRLTTVKDKGHHKPFAYLTTLHARPSS